MLEHTRRRENILKRQRQAREVTMDAANNLEKWVVEAEHIVNRSTEAVPPLTQSSLSGNARLTQWSLERLEEQRNAHESFCESRVNEGEELLKQMDDSFEDLMRVWPEISRKQSLASDSEVVVYTQVVVSRVDSLRKRYHVR